MYRMDFRQTKKRVMLVTHTPPPILAGTGVILRRLFRHFPKDSYVVLCSSYDDINWPLGEKLPCAYYTARVPSSLGAYSRSVAIREWMGVLPAVWKAWRVVRRERITSILSVPSAGTLLLVSCILSIAAGVELSVYFLDLYACNKHFKLRRWLSGPIERLAIRTAKNVFVMSEALKQHYTAKYCVETIVLPHPIELKDKVLNPSRPSAGTKDGRPAVIVFTGYIYEYQIDPLQNLAMAISGMDSVELHIYTSRSNDYLIKMGVYGKNIHYKGFVDTERIRLIQEQASILFLPMAFRPPEPAITRTASPGKLPEYLISGRPVLVHAPEYAYISWYARKYGWGLVVDQPDPELLKKGIRTLLDDSVLSGRLVGNAFKTARMHEESKVSNDLQKRMGLI